MQYWILSCRIDVGQVAKSAADIRRRHGNFVGPRRHNKYELRPRCLRSSPDTDRNSFRYSRECIPREQWSTRILGSKHVQIRRVLRHCLLVMLAMQCQPESRAGRGSCVHGFFCYLFAIICFVYSMFMCVSRRSAMSVRRIQRDDRFRERQSALRRLRSQHDRDRRWKGLRSASKCNMQMLLEPNKT